MLNTIPFLIITPTRKLLQRLNREENCLLGTLSCTSSTWNVKDDKKREIRPGEGKKRTSASPPTGTPRARGLPWRQLR